MIKLIVTGGQTGADQGAWRAAKAEGIATGGWMPRGFLTEQGPRPEFAMLYGADETTNTKYPPRTRANVKMCDALIWYGSTLTNGASLTLSMAQQFRKPYVAAGSGASVEVIAAWTQAQISTFATPVIMIGGNRESKVPYIQDAAEAFFTRVFNILLKRSQ